MRSILLASLLAALPCAATAADMPSYTFVEAGWTQLQIEDDFLDKGDGGYIRGSFAVAPTTYVFGGYSEVSKTWRASTINAELTVDEAEIGIGYRMDVADRLDFTADIAYVRLGVESDLRTGTFRETIRDHVNLWRGTAGLRGKPSPKTEAWIKAGYADGEDLDDNFFGVLGGQINLTRTWGLVGEVEKYSDTTQFQVGVRASF
ncbi:hypothetical protein LU699_04830 [Luteimonas fraxinea]|uniref:Outer membrane protein beta-barrel domain-containing protein n=1 Tax=Luteimonas fraxinea TaxID=2901869 RepID=A0ABS8UA54_9GAMM|nr:hypothetical protein [Luteimonas fraxinea]MCD9095765.1 hypothetical protein [Luteimonas fraxinea]MCD9124344.1 hypothetical protein [Luteimonas fraxinea]UHH11049.1 hypothetical protein LU699_04830 [Luteimonas fraxinea]